MKKKIVRATTVGTSLNTFCRGLLRELVEQEGYDIVAVSSPDRDLAEVGEREGVPIYGVKMNRHISPLQDLKSLYGLIRVFRREKPDMVHSMTPKAGLLCMMAAWLCRVPVRLHTVTGLVFPTSTGLKRKLLMTTDRLMCAFATHIVPEGEGVKSDLINHHITSKPLKVLGHGNIRGIDLALYEASLPEIKEAAAEIRQDGMFTFVFVGRLVGDKGINELVKAFSQLSAEREDVRLILVGRLEAELDPLADETLREIDSNPRIWAVGEKSDVRPWFAASDALVFPSYREGFPNVVIEAGALGLPSIVTDINGSREIIIEGENGTIIPARSVEALYVTLKRFVEDREATAAMASRSRELVASRYEQGYVRKCLKDYYRSLLSR